MLETLRGGGLNTEPLGQTIDQYMDENAIRASHIKYGLVITEMNTLRSVQCTLDDIPQGQLKDYMLASSACFPALRPYEIDGVKYIDGGWRDNMPLELAAKMGATELIGVDVDGVGLTRPNLTGLPTASSAAIGTWGRCLILTVCVPPKTLPGLYGYHAGIWPPGRYGVWHSAR
ncbi:patatin-like phospholipase family protein [Gemmiger qucibialis]|uniref:patatin-like phospholipase family protein n=1 Tax=Gemmiger qucibialis TaxID=2997294 RepID=UPI0022E82F28|nr:patatin-like phospholipase family protein [Gemmiger qucibialis]